MTAFSCVNSQLQADRDVLDWRAARLRRAYEILKRTPRHSRIEERMIRKIRKYADELMAELRRQANKLVWGLGL